MRKSTVKCSLFCFDLNQSEVLTQQSISLLWATKSSLRNALSQDLLSSTSPPTVVGTLGDLTVAFQTQTGKTKQLLKQSDLSTSYPFAI